MTIGKFEAPRAINLHLAQPAEAAVKQTLPFRGQRFTIRALALERQLFCALGFNPKYFKPGAHICLMDKENYARFAEACGIEMPGGIYPLAKNGYQEAVLKEELPYLPGHSRVIVLPEDHTPTTLIHEILHDIFIGGGLTPKERTEFSRELLHWYRLSIDPKMPHQHKNRPFYEAVAEFCKDRYDLKDLSPLYCGKRHWQERDFKVFASECFAYAGEAMLLPEEASFQEIPKPIVSFLRFLRIFNREAVKYPLR